MAPPLTQASLSDPVTKHLRRDFTPVNANQTVGEALDALRERRPEGRIIYFYVVDGENRLRGVVPTRRLLCVRRCPSPFGRFLYGRNRCRFWMSRSRMTLQHLHISRYLILRRLLSIEWQRDAGKWSSRCP